MRFSLYSFLGLVAGVIVLAVGILITGVGFGPYLSIASIFITFGGTICATIIGSPNMFLRNFFQYTRIAFSQVAFRSEQTIELMVELSDRARRDGLLALEDEIVNLPDEFARKGLQMVIDGTDPEIIQRTMNVEIDEMSSRHEQVSNSFEFMGKASPAFGLIGTIIGLIALLGNIGGDPAAIGRGMQTALITTLYGAVIANLVFLPIANKLREVDVEELRYYNIILEGILSIQSGDNPRIVRDRLIAFLSREERIALQIANDN